MITPRSILLILGLGCWPWLSPANAGDLKIIANPTVKISEISPEDLRAIFLGTSSSLKDAGPLHPVLDRRTACLGQFAAEYLGKSSTALDIYYRSLIFSGRWSMPVSFSSDQEVAAYVAKTRGAIGFVHDTASAQVKILKVR